MTTSRERISTVLAHRASDRIAVDFGATPTSGIHVSVVAGLRRHYGLGDAPVKVTEPYQMLGEIDSDLAAAMGIDTVSAPWPRTIFGFRNHGWRQWRTPWGQEVLVSADFQTDTRADGSLHIYPGGDRSAAPSGHLPAGGWFFDAIIRQKPLDEATLDPKDNCEEFGAITDADLAEFAAAVDAAHATGRAVVSTLPGTALGDIALVPGPFLKEPRGIRDIQEWYVSTASRQDYVAAIFEHQVRMATEVNLPRIHAAVGDKLSAVFLCGTDFGTQRGPMCSPRTFVKLWQPYYKRINDWIHAHTAWKVFKHSCGGIIPFLDPLADAGFDIINPVQCSATGMDPVELKRRFGQRLTFWGGGVDTQQVLPFGSPDEVRAQVAERCRIFAPEGGFVFNTIHNIQACTPTANVVAMVDAVRGFTG
jgi:hypothetical protein